jgi:hypothetical protein
MYQSAVNERQLLMCDNQVSEKKLERKQEKIQELEKMMAAGV